MPSATSSAPAASATPLSATLPAFERWLYANERSRATAAKYMPEVRRFLEFAGPNELTHELLLTYRSTLSQTRKPQTVNGILSALNAWLAWLGRKDLCVRFLKVQHCAFQDDARNLTGADYRKLLDTARKAGKERLYMVMLTLGMSGIRISELQYITVENARKGRALINLKGKSRIIPLAAKLQRRLLDYARKKSITSGMIFCTRGGRPLDRSNIFHEMKRLCERAGVAAGKVFPHNFRHLFARAFYELDKNLVRLADILGHSRLETTRIYVAEGVHVYEDIVNRMGLYPEDEMAGYKKIPQNNPSVVSS